MGDCEGLWDLLGVMMGYGELWVVMGGFEVLWGLLGVMSCYEGLWEARRRWKYLDL